MESAAGRMLAQAKISIGGDSKVSSGPSASITPPSLSIAINTGKGAAAKPAANTLTIGTPQTITIGKGSHGISVGVSAPSLP